MERAGYNNITPSGLKHRLDAGDRPVLLDVREPWEFELARIEGSTFIPMSELGERFTELDPGSETVVICHHGNRSSYVAQALETGRLREGPQPRRRPRRLLVCGRVRPDVLNQGAGSQ